MEERQDTATAGTEDTGAVTEGTETTDTNVSEETQGGEKTPQIGDDGFDYDGEVAKRTPKNILIENKRKSDELAELKSKLSKLEVGTKTPQAKAEVKPQPKTLPDNLKYGIQKYMETMKKPLVVDDNGNVAMSEGMIQEQLKMIFGIAEHIANDSVDSKFKPAEKMLYKDKLDSNIQSLASKNEYKYAVTKLDKELRKAMEMYEPKYWDDADLMEAELGKLIARNPKILFESKVKKEIESPTETGSIVNSSPQGSDSEIEKYAMQNGLPMETAEDRKKIREILTIKKRIADKSKSK